MCLRVACSIYGNACVSLCVCVCERERERESRPTLRVRSAFSASRICQDWIASVARLRSRGCHVGEADEIYALVTPKP